MRPLKQWLFLPNGGSLRLISVTRKNDFWYQCSAILLAEFVVNQSSNPKNNVFTRFHGEFREFQGLTMVQNLFLCDRIPSAGFTRYESLSCYLRLGVGGYMRKSRSELVKNGET